jgi:hypothetical protein
MGFGSLNPSNICLLFFHVFPFSPALPQTLRLSKGALSKGVFVILFLSLLFKL